MPLPRFFAVAAVLTSVVATPLRAQLDLGWELPWAITGAQTVRELQAKELQVVSALAGRDVYAVSRDGRMQAVAVLARDSLVGVIYFHPQNGTLNAADLFTVAASQAERQHGPAYCRRGEIAVWRLEDTQLEVRLRRPRGDGAAGAEIRYVSPHYAAEIARRGAAQRRTPSVRRATGRSGRVLLGVRVDSVAPTEPVDSASVAMATEPAPATSPAALRDPCDPAANP